ncbi:hypothetical protein EJB05_09127, partial [Eragrostis curvula]
MAKEEERAREKVMLVLGVLALEALIAGFHVVSRAALDLGVSKMAFLVYRNISALAVVAPFAYFLEKLEQVNIKGGYGLAKVPVLKKYPAKLSLFAIILALGLIQLLAVAPFFENDLEMWKIHSGGELLTILYAGVVATGLAWSLKIWCINKGGPLFVAVFQPLQSVMVAIMAAIFLGDQLYTGGVTGAVIIVFGLYCVLWAKSKEKKGADDRETEASMTRHLLHEECTSDNP